MITTVISPVESRGAKSIRVGVGWSELADLIPNYYRAPANRDRTRLPPRAYSGTPVVSYPDRPDTPTLGLMGRHIALWPSHGWYYEPAFDRWEWQRARLFQTVEDKLPLSFVLKYLVPMLENAGAEVYLPRERDTQTNLVVVDQDGSTGESQYVEFSAGRAIAPGQGPGFALGEPPYPEGLNPFLAGATRVLPPASAGSASVSWVPDIPDRGRYAVYLSYASPTDACISAPYRIRHAGGETRISVDQSRGGGTWIYAGRYLFTPGRNADLGSVVLDNSTAAGCTITADAVRFGGGMGNVVRGERTSERPRYLEAARYNLQYAGAPDTLVYDLSPEEADYTDDYRSRGEWVNWLRGAPFGPNKDRQADGLNIPIDLSLAFHTDAGITAVDSSIGTLSIYSTTGFDSVRVFPDGMSRMANRDLADIVQTQVVEDIRAKYDPDWRRRSLWDRDYSEAVRPNVPSVLLELLSHQNFYDMQFGLDPRFQSDVARSIYKAMLRFLSVQYNVDYVVQPIPVTHLAATLNGATVNGASADLSWHSQPDSLEPTAAPDRYVVQRRIDDGGWDSGFLVTDTRATVPIDSVGVIYSYRVLAVNDGGRSMPSEVIAVGRAEQAAGAARDPDKMVRVVSAFDRVSPPAWFDSSDLAGFAPWLDQGVPEGYDISYTGAQYDYDLTSPWRDDDEPGFGASHASLESSVVAGNTHDFVAVHGRAILNAGYSFDSASDEAVADGRVSLAGYAAIDVLLGEERATPRPKRSGFDFAAFPKALQNRLRDYHEQGGAMLVSGAYVGSDLRGATADSMFAADVLHIVYRTNHASTTGSVYSIRNAADLRLPDFTFETELNELQYAVEAPDAIEPANGAFRFLRYDDSNMNAGVGFDGSARVAVLGFPLEAIRGDVARNAVFEGLLDFLIPQVSR